MLDMFSEKLQDSLSNLARKKNITEEDIKVSIKEIRYILLEADVNFKVVKEFCKTIEAKAIEEEVLKGLNPSEQITKIVKDEMIALLEGENELKIQGNKTIMMVGLQGSGKTTTTGKLATYLRKKKRVKKPLLVACDVYRPAAIDQLITIAKQLAVDIYYEKDNMNVLEIAKNARNFAKENKNDLIILDTAGRMHLDEKLMQEVTELQKEFTPDETLLVLDGTVGQLAVEVSQSFNEKLNITGLIFTKMDGDTRGGGIFSVKKVTGIDIKFLGTSEKMDGIEEFVATRVVSRILGMGDVLGLIEKAEEFQDEESEKMAEKMLEGNFDLNDFLSQMKKLRKMGGLTSIMSMLPGMKKMNLPTIDEKELKRVEAIIESMTIEERTKPSILNAKRRVRIANGSGTKVQDVNKLITGYEQMKKMMKQMKNMSPSQMNNMINRLK